MKTTIALTVFGLLLAGVSAPAQDSPPAKKWDISKLDLTKLPPASEQKDVTFDKDILPLFKASCVRCHGGKKPRAGLELDTLEGALKGGHDGKMVVPGDSKNSLLVAAAARIDKSIAMPPQRRPRGGPPGGGTNNTPPPSGQPGGPGPGGPGGGPRGGPPAKPLTTDEVALVRAWIDQGAK